MGDVENYINKAKTKLASSRLLFDNGDYSDSVSLSYYCMFLIAKALLINKGCNVGKSHRGLISQFSLKFVHEDNFNYDIYKYLADTQSLREEADYDAIDSISKGIASRKIREAEEFLSEAQKFL